MTTETQQTAGPGPAGDPEPVVSEVQWAAARTDVTTEIARTDAKAGALLSGLSLPLAVLIAAVQGRELSTPVTVLVGLGGGGLVIALVMVLLVVRPTLYSRHTTVPGSFLHWAECSPAELTADLTADHRAERIVTLSRIARRKHTALRQAIHVMIGALALLAGALVAGLV
ncbi:Pycsar system effector family protein [Kitasatospora sp. NPDC094028]